MNMREIMMIIGDDQPQTSELIAKGPVWLWRAEPPAKGAWYFLSITSDIAAALRTAADGRSHGWGSIKIWVTIGATRWQTSLFPSKSAGGFLLPIKADVRRRENIVEGSIIEARLSIG